jgi:prepilin-type N-terminal cleavage/methylation domain-containing protein
LNTCNYLQINTLANPNLPKYTNFKTMKQKLKNCKGFTLIETLTVVIIVGLLAGLAVLKLADAKDRSEINYLKGTAALLDRNIEVSVVKFGAFPDIPDGTPEERIAFILTELQDKNILVNLERMDPKGYALYLKPLLADIASGDISKAAVLSALKDFRNGLDSGSPKARELLVLPRGVIVYPEKPVFEVNDPNQPNYDYYYTEYWRPLETKAAADYFKANGTYRTEEERNLVMNNIAYSGFDTDTLLSLIQGNDASLNASINSQLIDILNNPSGTNLDLQTSDLVELIEQGLNGVYAEEAIKDLDLSKLDWDTFSLNTIASIVASKGIELTSDQVDSLMAYLDTVDKKVPGIYGDTTLYNTPEIDAIAYALAKLNLTDSQYINLMDKDLLSAQNYLFKQKLLKGNPSSELVNAFMDNYLATGFPYYDYDFDNIVLAAKQKGYTIQLSDTTKQAMVERNNIMSNSQYDWDGPKRMNLLLDYAPELVTSAMLDKTVLSTNTSKWDRGALITKMTSLNLPLSATAKSALLTEVTNTIGGLTSSNWYDGAYSWLGTGIMSNPAFSSAEIDSVVAALNAKRSAGIPSYNAYNDLIKNPNISAATRAALLNPTGNYASTIQSNVVAQAILTPTEFASFAAYGTNDQRFQALARNVNLTGDQLNTIIQKNSTSPNSTVFSALYNNTNVSSATIQDLATTAILNNSSVGAAIGMYITNTTRPDMIKNISESVLASYIDSGSTMNAATLELLTAQAVFKGKIEYGNLSAEDKETVQLALLSSNIPRSGTAWSTSDGNAQGKVYAAILADSTQAIQQDVIDTLVADTATTLATSKVGNLMNSISTTAFKALPPTEQSALTEKLFSYNIPNTTGYTTEGSILSQVGAKFGASLTDSTQIDKIWNGSGAYRYAVGELLKNPNVSDTTLDSMLSAAISSPYYYGQVYDNPRITDAQLNQALSSSYDVVSYSSRAAKIVAQDIVNNINPEDPWSYYNQVQTVMYSGTTPTEDRLAVAEKVSLFNDSYLSSDMLYTLASQAVNNNDTQIKNWLGANSDSLLQTVINSGDVWTMDGMLRNADLMSVLTLNQKRQLQETVNQTRTQ